MSVKHVLPIELKGLVFVRFNELVKPDLFFLFDQGRIISHLGAAEPCVDQYANEVFFCKILRLEALAEFLDSLQVETLLYISTACL